MLLSLAPSINRFGLRMCKNVHDAEDVLQETLINVAQHLGDFEGRSSLTSWAFALTRSACARKRRGLKNQPHVSDERLAESQDPAPSPEARLADQELASALSAALDWLSDEHREVILLRDVEGLSSGGCLVDRHLGGRPQEPASSRPRCAPRCAPSVARASTRADADRLSRCRRAVVEEARRRPEPGRLLRDGAAHPDLFAMRGCVRRVETSTLGVPTHSHGRGAVRGPGEGQGRCPGSGRARRTPNLARTSSLRGRLLHPGADSAHFCVANPRRRRGSYSSRVVPRQRRNIMCRRIECAQCKKPSYAGCGMHVEQVLSDVPRAERCRCREKPKKAAVAAPSIFRRLFGQ